MLITNAVKVVGCILMLFSVHPLLAYAVVGFGAAAYSPAKYGILTELLPPSQLVVANGWIEGTTVGSIILGVLLGGLLVSHNVSHALLGFRHADHRHRHQLAAGSRHHRHCAAVSHRRHHQLVHPDTASITG
jgi:MFS family permease